MCAASTLDVQVASETTPLLAAAAWLSYAEGHWNEYPGRPDLGFFGTGTVAIQSVEAVAEHAFVCAVMARHPDCLPVHAPDQTTLTSAHLTQRALAALRYLLATHVTGTLDCVAGTSGVTTHSGEPAGRGQVGSRRWGADGWSPVPAFFTWLVAEALGEDLPQADRLTLCRMLAHEANANLADQRTTVLEHHGYFREVPPIPTGRFGISWPESNAWRAAMLSAALLELPSHPNASRWDDSLKRHFINSLSVPQDRESTAIVDGKPVSERFAGANVHPNFGLEHHGFFHPCYAARTMEFMVLAAWAFERRNQPAPECTQHHLVDEWHMVRRLTLWQGRIAYPAGADHHRYGWGMTYLLPVLTWLQREHGDATAEHLERSISQLILDEQRANGDGSFARERMGALLKPGTGPGRRAGERSRVLYYRAEADPPFYLLLSQLIRGGLNARPDSGSATSTSVGAAGSTDGETGSGRHQGEPPPDVSAVEEAICGTFEEPDAGLVLRRDPGRFASWSWNAYPDVAQGLFVPRNGDYLVEWNGNLAPTFVVQDAPGRAARSVAWKRTVTVDGGFATCGLVRHCDGAVLQHALYVALPDGRSVLYADDVRAAWDLTLLYQEGLRLNVQNDLFNQYRRHVRFAGGEASLQAEGGRAPASLVANQSPWLEVDGLLGVRFLDGSAKPWTFRTFPHRNATDMSSWYATLSRPLSLSPRLYAAGAVIQRTCVQLAGNVSTEANWWESPATCGWAEANQPPTLHVTLRGFDGQRYEVTANWADRTVALARLPGSATE